MAVRATCIAGTVCISSIARIPGLVKGRVSNFSGTVSRRHRRAAPSRGPGPPPARRRRGEHRECGADPRGRRRDGGGPGAPTGEAPGRGPQAGQAPGRRARPPAQDGGGPAARSRGPGEAKNEQQHLFCSTLAGARAVTSETQRGPEGEAAVHEQGLSSRKMLCPSEAASFPSGCSSIV